MYAINAQKCIGINEKLPFFVRFYLRQIFINIVNINVMEFRSAGLSLFLVYRRKQERTAILIDAPLGCEHA